MSDRRGLRREGSYTIEAILNDGTFHLFTSQVLDVMLANNRVSRFRRSSGWVTIGVDPVRVKCRREDSHHYYGHDRRAAY